MMRLIVRVVNVGSAVNVGGPPDTTFKTFDVDASDVEEFIRLNSVKYATTEVVGVEILGKDQPVPCRLNR